MNEPRWHRIGPVEDLRMKPLQAVVVDGRPVALSWIDGRFGAISGTCLHAGGPLGEGVLKDGYVVCPWHHWMFHASTGEARPGIPAAVSRFALKEEEGQLYIDLDSATQARRPSYPPHPLAREIRRDPGPVRIVGISTTVMERGYPRFSTSEFLLEAALRHAAEAHGAATKLIRLNDLQFRNCEGFYSKSAHACTWPCSITQMDPKDQLDQVYEALVHGSDIALIATPIRWGNASSLYYKMAERMNCVQNQVTIADRVLIRNKVAAFIITGGQDNVQSTAGQMLTFFSELGYVFPRFPFIASSRGWSAEDMENNQSYVRGSEELQLGARSLVDRCIEKSSLLIAAGSPADHIERGGRKANPIQ